MTFSVRKSDAMKDTLDRFLSGKSAEKSPYELCKDLIGPHTDETLSEDVARKSKRLLREGIRGKGK